MRNAIAITVVALVAMTAISDGDPLPGFQHVIAYDGFLHEFDNDPGSPAVFADTLIVVSNPDPTDQMLAKLEVFDKKGEPIWEGMLWDGGRPIDAIPPNGFGWITLGMVVSRDTFDPFGKPGGEKFYIRISVQHRESQLNLVPPVEIKQVVYTEPVAPPEMAIWQPRLFKTWSETALGGNKNATGVIYSRP